MKLILKREVEHLGKPGDVVEVKEGYARNYLLPRRMAVKDSPHERLMAKGLAEKFSRDQQEKIKTAKGGADKLDGKAITIAMKVSPEQKLFGSVTAQQIAKELAALGVKVDRRRIIIAEPIKTIGTHEVEVKLHSEVVAKIKVEVVGE